ERVRGALGRDLLYLLEGPIEEIVGAINLTTIHSAGGLQPSGEDLAFAHEAGLDEVGEHDIGAGAGRRKVDMRRITGRGLEEAGDHGRFGEVQILDAFVEIEVGCGCDTEGASAKIGAV